MTLNDFKETLSRNDPPQNSSVYLMALWFEAKGNWDEAHHLIKDISDKNAAWIHAYLHRKEGDIFNAEYWYKRAGKKRPDVNLSLENEWEEIAEALL
jgi:hypothetical protein